LSTQNIALETNDGVIQVSAGCTIPTYLTSSEKSGQTSKALLILLPGKINCLIERSYCARFLVTEMNMTTFMKVLRKIQKLEPRTQKYF